jgi:hypothetical protein
MASAVPVVFDHLLFPQHRTPSGVAREKIVAAELSYTAQIDGTDELVVGVSAGVEIDPTDYPVNVLVSAQRQVELAGTQTITGDKTIDVGKLHVLGGANGNRLVTDGDGNLSWQAPGQYVSGIVPLASEVLLANGVTTNIASRALAIGKWLIWGEIWFDTSVGSTNISQLRVAITSQSATLPADVSDAASYTAQQPVTGPASQASDVLTLGMLFADLAVATPYYVVARADYSGGGQVSAYGKIAGVFLG